MPKSIQANELSPDKKIQKKSENAAEFENPFGQFSSRENTSDELIYGSDGFQKQTGLLSNPNFQLIDRQTIAAHIGDVYGNHYLQQVIGAIDQTPQQAGATVRQTTVQRQANNHDEDNTSEDEGNRPVSLPPDVEALIDQLFPAQHVPAFEAIAATTQAENSIRDFTHEDLTRLWRREHLTFTEAARQVAAREPHRGTPHATQSPQAPESDDFHPRWALYFANWDYQGWIDLPDIRTTLRRGSPFQRALRGEFEQVLNQENKTADQMRELLRNTINEMQAHALGGVAELMVYFSGHGGGNGIDGIDNQVVGFGELNQVVQLARTHNIHMTFILDSCNIGQIVTYAQVDTARELNELAQRAPGTTQQWVSRQLGFAANLIRHSSHLGEHLYELYSLRNELQQPNEQQQAFDLFQNFHSEIEMLGNTIAAANPSEEISLNELSPLRIASSACSGVTIQTGLHGVNKRSVMRLRRVTAPLLDALNDVIRSVLSQVRNRLAQS